MKGATGRFQQQNEKGLYNQEFLGFNMNCANLGWR